MLQTPLGDGLVLAPRGGRHIFVLNASAAALWELHGTGLDAGAMADLLARRFGLDLAVIRHQVDKQMRYWAADGLLDRDVDEFGPEPPAAEVIPSTRSVLERASPVWLSAEIGGVKVDLSCPDAELRSWIEPWWRPLEPDDTGLSRHGLELCGTVSDWALWADGRVLASGTHGDDAVVALMSQLIELGAQTDRRLLVVHGAGLVTPDQLSYLLIAPGGSGKTTLAAALHASGHPLLSDDVVPVTLDGGLVGLGTPLCVKSGSWPVLAGRWPELTRQRVMQRFGQPVRYLPRRGARLAEAANPGLLLFPRYQPGCQPTAKPLSPESALQGIIEAEALIRHLTQAKLEALVGWVGSIPAYALRYPDLDSGMELAERLLVVAAASKPPADT